MIAIMSDALLDLFNAHIGCARRLVPGEFLFHRDEPVAALFIVVEGEVQLIRHQEGGDAIILQRAGHGDILAEASVFSSCYHYDGVTRTGAVVRSVEKGKSLDRFRNDPKFAEAWASHLACEVQATRFRSEILSFRTVAKRLDAWLAWHGNLPLKGEWVQFAFQVGISPEALYREMARRRK